MADFTLEEIVKFSKAHKVTPVERRAQRISLMMGLRSEKSTMTREEISILLDNIEGRDPKSENIKVSK
jgi:hypothetical protein